MASLTSDKEPNNLVHGVPFCVIIHKSYKLLKTVHFLGGEGRSAYIYYH